MNDIINFSQKGDFDKLEKFLSKNRMGFFEGVLEKYGQKGVELLYEATPKNTGKTAASWYYKIERKKDSVTLTWCNSNINDNVPIAVIIQYGHSTGGGYYVEGIDYINPALKPVFEKIAKEATEEISK